MTNFKDRIVIIIPSLNPDERIINLVSSLKINGFHHIVVINDGSTSSYLSYFQKLDLEFGCKILTHAVNLGKGRALKTAFNYILCHPNDLKGVITVDSDGQHSIKDVINIANLLYSMDEEDPSLILGTRLFIDKTIPLRSRFGNIVTSKVLKLLCGISISDTQTGLRGIPLSLIGILLNINGERFEYEMNMILESKEYGYSFTEIPIKTIYLANNESSHFNPLKDSIKIYSTIAKYTFTSLLSVLIDFSIFSLCLHYTSWLLVSTYIGRLGSAIVNFSLNKNMVFGAKGHLLIQLLEYLLLVFISGSCSAILIFTVNRIFGIQNLVFIKAIAECLLFFANYYLQKNIIFNKHDKGIKR